MGSTGVRASLFALLPSAPQNPLGVGVSIGEERGLKTKAFMPVLA
jgi:hypothetical protein